MFLEVWVGDLNAEVGAAQVLNRLPLWEHLQASLIMGKVVDIAAQNSVRLLCVTFALM